MSQTIEQPRFTCALGSCQSVVAIKKGVPILHSGPGCGVQVERLIGQGEGYAGGSTMPCTNAEEADVVFGGIIINHYINQYRTFRIPRCFFE